jgi:hypothetical protein
VGEACAGCIAVSDPTYETDQDVGIGGSSPANSGSGQGTVPGSPYETDQDVGIHPADQGYAQAVGTGVLGGIPFAKDIAAASSPILKNYVAPTLQAIGRPINRALGINQADVDKQWQASQNAMPSTYAAGRAAIDKASAESAQEHPDIQTGASLATGAALMPGGAAVSTLPRAMATGAATGAAYGASDGSTLDDRLRNAAWGAGFGTVGGAGGYGLGKAIAPATGAVADAANRIGVSMPRYMMANPAVQRVGTVAQSVPLAGEFVRSAAGHATGQLADSVQNLGNNVSPATAGEQISGALNNWIGPTSKGITDRYYQHATSQLDPTVTTPISATNALVARLQQQAANRGSTLSGPDLTEIANANTMGGGLTYNAMKDLRTTINQMKSTWGNINPDPAVSARISQLHGALSQDLDAAAQNADRTGQGFAAHQNASRIYSGVQDNNEALTPLIGPQGDKPPEQVFANLYRKASDNPSSADINLLQRAKTAVQNSATPQAWNTFEQGVINRLGVGKSGFTPDLYLNHYSSIPDAAKDVLFSPQNRAALDDAATVAQQMKSAGFAKNPSGTSHGTMAGLATAGAIEYGGEMLHHPILTATGIGAGYGVGKALTGPVTGPGAGGVRNYLATQLARRSLPVAAGQFGAGYGATP